MEASTSAVGSIPYTAGLLGISRTGLYRRMRRYGPVAFAGEATTPPIVAELDTYIYVDNPNTSYGSATELYHGVDTELGTDWRRSCFRFNRDGYVPAGATIKAITLRLRFTFVQYLPAGGIQILELQSDDWNENSTKNNFNLGGARAWSDGIHIGSNELT